MKIEYSDPEECEVQEVNVELDGKFIIVSQCNEPTDRFAERTEFVACGILNTVGIPYEDFLNNYIYIEKLRTGVLQRVIFSKDFDEADKWAKFPNLVGKEVIDEDQLAVLCMIHNVLLD